jgi:hypothetical protein
MTEVDVHMAEESKEKAAQSAAESDQAAGAASASKRLGAEPAATAGEPAAARPSAPPSGGDASGAAPIQTPSGHGDSAAAAGAPSAESAGNDAGADSGAAATSAGGADSAPDVWGAFDAVIEAFANEWRLAPGTYWGATPAEVEGRFVGWANTVGWRCTLQLVRAPEENVVVLVAQGPPLPGGRVRMLVLGAFPPDFDQPTFRAALEVGYSIGETWGPAEEPPAPAGEPSPEAGADPPPSAA